MIDTKNPAKVHNDMAMIALLKSNNPNFKGRLETLMKYYNRDPKSPKPKLSKEEDTFLQNFSKNYIWRGGGCWTSAFSLTRLLSAGPDDRALVAHLLEL